MFALLNDIVSSGEWNYLNLMPQYPLRRLVKSDILLTEIERFEILVHLKNPKNILLFSSAYLKTDAVSFAEKSSERLIEVCLMMAADGVCFIHSEFISTVLKDLH